MSPASFSRLVPRVLFAMTLSGVLQSGLPTDRPKRKMRMAETEAEAAKQAMDSRQAAGMRSYEASES